MIGELLNDSKLTEKDRAIVIQLLIDLQSALSSGKSYVSAMVRRIAAILLLQPALDSNYVAVKMNAHIADPVETGA